MSDLTQKIKITVRTNSYIYLDYESIDNAIKSLTDAKEQAEAEGFEELTIRLVRDCGCYSECNCSSSPTLFGKRLETDMEYNKRIKDQTDRQANIEKYEKEQLVRLKKKYGV